MIRYLKYSCWRVVRNDRRNIKVDFLKKIDILNYISIPVFVFTFGLTNLILSIQNNEFWLRVILNGNLILYFILTLVYYFAIILFFHLFFEKRKYYERAKSFDIYFKGMSKWIKILKYESVLILSMSFFITSLIYTSRFG